MSGLSETQFADSTPRPWYFDGWDIFTAFNSAGVRGDGHRLVIPLSHLNNTFHPSQRVNEADVRLIVEAVNAYERYGNALREIAGDGDSNHVCGRYVEIAREALRAD